MANSRYVSHIKWWFFIVPLLTVVLLPFMPDPEFFKIPTVEQSSVRQVVGADKSQGAVIETNAAFKRLFVSTGMVGATLHHHTSLIGDAGVSALAYHWTMNFWRMVYRMVYRVIVLRFWALGGLIMCMGAFIDGTVRGKISASAAGSVSPLSFHLASHGIVLLLGTILIVLVIPVPVLAFYWVGVCAVLALLFWRAAGAFQR